MKILIVGSKGFIGSHCILFFNKKYETWGCDVLTDYTEKNYFLIETLNPTYNTILQQQFDFCINCAGAASVSDSLKFPSRDYELNTHLVFRLLDSIRVSSPTCKFINISSAAVYGDPKSWPITEDSPLEPVSPYGVHKMLAEKICKEFTTYFSIGSCSIRIFSAYGPGLKKQIFWDLLQRAKNNNVVKLFGTGEETRDYIFISDIVIGIETVIDKASFNGECYNLGSGKPYKIKDVAHIFFQCLGWKGELLFSGEKREGDPNYWEADIKKISELGFRKIIDLEVGIKKYIEWAQDLPSD